MPKHVTPVFGEPKADPAVIEESVTRMLASAAPYLARDSAMPVFITEADRGKAEVHVGTPFVVPENAKDDAGRKKS